MTGVQSVQSIIYILLLLGLSCLGEWHQCPPAERIFPCSCGQSSTNVTVKCNKLNNSENLALAISGLQGYFINQFILENANLTDLPRGIFHGCNITHLVIRNSILKRFAPALGNGPSPFQGLEKTLKTFSVVRTTVGSWKWEELSMLGVLTKVTVSASSMMYVSSSFSFINSSSLRVLYLLGSCIRTVDTSSMSTFQYLTEVSLERNMIKILERSVFPTPAKYLKIIDLSSNQISSFHPRIFDDMPALERVSLRRNNIQIVNEVRLSSVWDQLVLFDLYGNPIICDCKLKWIIGRKAIYEKQNERLHCQGPSKFLGKEVGSLRAEELQCSGLSWVPAATNRNWRKYTDGCTSASDTDVFRLE